MKFVWLFMPELLELQAMSRVINDLPGMKVTLSISNRSHWKSLPTEIEPDIAVVSYDMEMPSGYTIARTTKADYPNCGVVLLSRRPSDVVLVGAAEIGAEAVVNFNRSLDDLEREMRDAADHHSTLSPLAVEQARERLRTSEGDLLLDADEVDLAILRRLTLGYTDQQISDELFLAVQSVKNRISRMLIRYRMNNRTQLAIYFDRQHV